jgi:hypothetical protein
MIMPPADQILNGLREIADTWKLISLFWHVYFGVVVVLLAIGIQGDLLLFCLGFQSCL